MTSGLVAQADTIVVPDVPDALNVPFTRRDALAVFAHLARHAPPGLFVWDDLYDAFAVEWRKAEIR